MPALTVRERGQDARRPIRSTDGSFADHTLVPPDEVRFPKIPANIYGGVPRPA